jgi:hypothetical protein
MKMDYEHILSRHLDNALPLCREIVSDDAQLAQAILEAMIDKGIALPVSGASFSNVRSVQGNLGEFCVRELGDKHWQEWSSLWASNAGTPWSESSVQGIDILGTDADVRVLFVIEVKTSRTNGSNLVNSQQDSLRSDFARLFTADPRKEGRLANHVGRLYANLKNIYPQIGSLKKLVGTSPETSPGVRLIGVLVCTQGNNKDTRDRHQAFQQLHKALADEKWRSAQCKYYIRLLELKERAACFDVSPRWTFVIGTHQSRLWPNLAWRSAEEGTFRTPD